MSDIGKRAVVIIAVKRGIVMLAGRCPVFAVDEEDVGPAIAIQIDKRTPRSNRFGQQLFALRTGMVDERDASLLRNVNELNRICFRSRGAQ